MPAERSEADSFARKLQIDPSKSSTAIGTPTPRSPPQSAHGSAHYICPERYIKKHDLGVHAALAVASLGHFLSTSNLIARTQSRNQNNTRRGGVPSRGENNTRSGTFTRRKTQVARCSVWHRYRGRVRKPRTTDCRAASCSLFLPKYRPWVPRQGRPTVSYSGFSAAAGVWRSAA